MIVDGGRTTCFTILDGAALRFLGVLYAHDTLVGYCKVRTLALCSSFFRVHSMNLLVNLNHDGDVKALQKQAVADCIGICSERGRRQIK